MRAVRVGAADLLAGDHDVGDAARIGLVEELAVGDIAAAGALPGILEQGHERQHQQEDDDPQGEIAEVRVHRDRFCPWGSRRRCPSRRPASPRSANLGVPAPLAKGMRRACGATFLLSLTSARAAAAAPGQKRDAPIRPDLDQRAAEASSCSARLPRARSGSSRGHAPRGGRAAPDGCGRPRRRRLRQRRRGAGSPRARAEASRRQASTLPLPAARRASARTAAARAASASSARCARDGSEPPGAPA